MTIHQVTFFEHLLCVRLWPKLQIGKPAGPVLQEFMILVPNRGVTVPLSPHSVPLQHLTRSGDIFLIGRIRRVQFLASSVGERLAVLLNILQPTGQRFTAENHLTLNVRVQI